MMMLRSVQLCSTATGPEPQDHSIMDWEGQDPEPKETTSLCALLNNLRHFLLVHGSIHSALEKWWGCGSQLAVRGGMPPVYHKLLGLEDTEHNFSADSKNQDPGVSKKSATGSSKGQGTGKRANTVSNNFNKDSYKKSESKEHGKPNSALLNNQDITEELQKHMVRIRRHMRAEAQHDKAGGEGRAEATDLDIKDVIALETNTRVSPYRRQSSIDPVLQETMFGARRVGLLRDWAGKAPDERKLKSLMEKGTEPKMEIAKMLKPEEVLSCRYLRLSKNNIKTLIKLCKDAGMDVDIHPHMVEAEIDSKKIFDHQLSTAL
ncbi:hypothetical protein NN561_007151 [Cricetulus griseus]